MGSVLTAGHINWDVTLHVDRLPEADGESAIRSQHQSGGGSAANVAAALSGFDIDTGLIGSVGDDDNGLLAQRELVDAGVSLDGVRVIEDAATAVKYLLVDDDGEVAILGNDGVNEAVTPADLDRDRIRSVDHVHLTGQQPETAAAIARTAHEAGVVVSFDPGRRVSDRDYSTTLSLADILFLNDREASTMLDEEDARSAFSGRIAVHKCGGEGAVVHTPDGSHSHPGFDVDPVDTTGAGDAFAAGFIATTIDRGGGRTLTDADIEHALEYANACGALTAARAGARSAPSRTEVEVILAGHF